MGMRVVFEAMDMDEDGFIEKSELQSNLRDPALLNCLAAMGMQPEDTERLFWLCDLDNSGNIDIHEFVSGCLRMKGVARSIDVHEVLMLQQRILKHLGFSEYSNERPAAMSGAPSL